MSRVLATMVHAPGSASESLHYLANCVCVVAFCRRSVCQLMSGLLHAVISRAFTGLFVSWSVFFISTLQVCTFVPGYEGVLACLQAFYHLQITPSLKMQMLVAQISAGQTLSYFCSD